MSQLSVERISGYGLGADGVVGHMTSIRSCLKKPWLLLVDVSNNGVPAEQRGLMAVRYATLYLKPVNIGRPWT